MALQELFLEIWLFVMVLNGGVLIVDSLIDTPLRTPFDTDITVSGVQSGAVTGTFNTTSPDGTLVANMTNATMSESIINETSGDNLVPADILQPLAVVWQFIQFLTGGFLFDVLGIFGFPDIFIFVMQGIMGLLLARIVIYYWLGR